MSKTNDLLFTSSVVLCNIMQVCKEKEELNAKQTTPVVERDDKTLPITPTSTEEDVKSNNNDVELVFHQENASNCENYCVQLEIPRSELILHNVNLITYKEVLTRIFPNDSLCYIMFDDPWMRNLR